MLSENRFPPPIGSGAGFFGIMLYTVTNGPGRGAWPDGSRWK